MGMPKTPNGFLVGFRFRRLASALASVFGSALFLLPSLEAQDVIISELLARNIGSVVDDDNDSSDWIELHNLSASPVDLAGWALTDEISDLSKWTFPPLELPPGGFLIVFASGKDRSAPDDELHTNFKLSGDGEYFALIRPDLEIASAFTPEFPEQILDVSYGFPMNRSIHSLISTTRPTRLFVPLTNAELSRDWNTAEFDDATWLATASPSVGFDRSEELSYAGAFETDVGDAMVGINASIFLRIPLEIPVGEELGFLELRMRYDSGFIAYLNGEEIARSNVRSTRYNSTARSERAPAAALASELFPILVPKEVLLPEGNVLAIHAQDNSRTSLSFLAVVEAQGVYPEGVAEDAPAFFGDPTPGWTNPDSGQEGLSRPPRFSVTGSTFVGSMDLELTAEGDGTEIRFTLDGTFPSSESPLYAGPLTFTEVTRVVARTFETGKVPSEPVSHTFIALDPEIVDFSSDIPIVVVSGLGSLIGGATFAPMEIQVFDVGEDGRSRLTSTPQFFGSGGIKERGSSSAGRPKKAYSMEIQDIYGRDKDAEILGFPPDSDFILYAAYNFDRALMRNPFMYRLARSIGRYAVRDRFCEVYLNAGGNGGGLVASGDYVGVYSFLEKIGRGEHRVDVEELPATAIEEPEITGGYILKIDRPDPGDSGFTVGGVEVHYVTPKEADIEKVPEQTSWIREYFTDFTAALSTTTLIDAENYGDFIDVPSWIDHHILNEFAKNPDGFWLSTYFSKPREGKVFMGPIWDFDRALGPNDDDRAVNPVGWSGVRSSNWWARLLRDPEFLRMYSARWLELRADVLRTENLVALIDDMQAELREAQARNFQRWRALSLGTGGWDGQVDRLRNWIVDRAEWMDSQLVPAPKLSHVGGPVEAGLEVTLTSPAGTIYYTVNGPDPRAEGGAIAAEALPFETPIVINGNTRIWARTLIGVGTWSEEVIGSYATDVPPILITEVMYDPPELGDGRITTKFEFLELFNAGDETLDLDGWGYRQDSNRILFDFSLSEPRTLAPGEYGVLVNDTAQFRTRYGDGPTILGEYSTSLSNRGDTIIIQGPLGEPYVHFAYEPFWHPSTAGEGHSLVLVDPPPARDRWSEAEAWQPSADIAGSPGRQDVLPAGLQLPGDLTQDRVLNIADVVELLKVFRGETSGPCSDARGNGILANVNGGPGTDLSDLLYLLNHLFLRGPAPVGGESCQPIPGCPTSCAS